jgi:hypothetical protein
MVRAIDRTPILQLKKALENSKTETIDLLLDEILMMPFTEESRNILSVIWDHVLASEYKDAAALVDSLID